MATFDCPFSKQGQQIEQAAARVRAFYNLPLDDIVAPEMLLSCMPVEFVSPRVLSSLGDELLEQLHTTFGSMWDAATLPVPIDGRYVVLLNEAQPATRMRITRMEELLHIHFGHRPTKLFLSSNGPTGTRMRTYNAAEEKEAYSVGAALLVPWRKICFEVNKGRSSQELAEKFYVSRQLMDYRINTTGLSKLYRSRVGA